jgi:hypothetical protein
LTDKLYKAVKLKELSTLFAPQEVLMDVEAGGEQFFNPLFDHEERFG